MQPSTAYCPTLSPALSLGSKEKAVRHLRQKPSVRPGLPSRPRPTGALQFEQNRFPSGTCGLTMISVIGSLAGTGGTSISPAPRLPRRERPVLPPREPRVRLETEVEFRLEADVLAV